MRLTKGGRGMVSGSGHASSAFSDLMKHLPERADLIEWMEEAIDIESLDNRQRGVVEALVDSITNGKLVSNNHPGVWVDEDRRRKTG